MGSNVGFRHHASHCYSWNRRRDRFLWFTHGDFCPARIQQTVRGPRVPPLHRTFLALPGRAFGTGSGSETRRASGGMEARSGRPRHPSSVEALVVALPALPIITAATGQKRLGRSKHAVNASRPSPRRRDRPTHAAEATSRPGSPIAILAHQAPMNAWMSAAGQRPTLDRPTPRPAYRRSATIPTL
jgi:hypothetical protein